MRLEMLQAYWYYNHYYHQHIYIYNVGLRFRSKQQFYLAFLYTRQYTLNITRVPDRAHSIALNHNFLTISAIK